MAIYAISIVIGYGMALLGREKTEVVPMKSPLPCLTLLVLAAVLAAGCVGVPSLSGSPTVIPTLTVTPGPSTAAAPPTIPPVNSLATGTQITRDLQGGFGRLVIKNHVIGQDAVLILAPADDPKRAVLAVYVTGQHDWTVDGITDGQYVLYDMIGTNWDDANKRFEHTSEYARFDSTLNFYTTPTESKVFTVTLSGAGGGDSLSSEVAPGDLPALG